MKIKNILLGFAVSCASLLYSCQKEFVADQASDVIVSSTSSLSFNAEGGAKSITITANNTEWKIDNQSHDSWLTAVKEDNNRILLTAPKYDGVEERSTVLTILTAKGKQEFNISQFGSAPILRLEDSSTDFTFKKEAEERVLKVITNSPDWHVTATEDTPWFSWEKDADASTLTLKLKEFLRTDDNATTNRKTVLYISNGSRHLRLDILQRGWAQFGDPFFKFNATREEIIEEETRRGHERKLDYELKLYPVGEEGNKSYIAYSTDGEQTEYMLYRFVYGDNYKKFDNRVFMIAKQGQTFDENDLSAWLEYNKFKKARDKYFESWKPEEERYVRYYREEDDKFRLYNVYNHPRAYVPAPLYRSAYLEYTERSNDLTFETNAITGKVQATVFPTRNSVRLHDVTYQLDQVIAYEQSKGMIPDYDHNLTIRSTYAGVPYATLVFKQAQPNSSDGQLVHVIYRFNYPGATDYDEKGQPTSQATILSHNPALAGTVGSRMDVYQNPDLIYQKRPIGYTGDYTSSLTITFRGYADEKCFDFVRSDESGFSTFVRGDEELVDITPGDKWFTMTFYRSKELVNIINNKNK